MPINYWLHLGENKLGIIIISHMVMFLQDFVKKNEGTYLSSSIFLRLA